MVYGIDQLVAHLIQLIKKVSVKLPDDVITALEKAAAEEMMDSPQRMALSTILRNIALAKQYEQPLCQDTGVPNFFVYHPRGNHPRGISQMMLNKAISHAVQEATDSGYLRPNAVCSISGTNSGNNLGLGLPNIYYTEWNKPQLLVQLLLKGGGSENVSTQFALPYSPINANRDLDGVRKVCLQAVFNAQGRGCAPGILGVCIGGDRASGYIQAKKQLLRRLDEPNTDESLDLLEKEILKQSNSLGIGPMGLGGKTTLLGVKIGFQHRHPACYFVTVSYMCWALRRGSLSIDAKGDLKYE